MSQAAVSYVLQRNFSFFHFTSVLYEKKEEQNKRLQQHALHFLALESTEGQELVRRFFSEASLSPSKSGRLPRPDDLVVVLIEKRQTSRWAFFRQQRAVDSQDNGDDKLWNKPKQMGRGSAGITSRTAEDAYKEELVVSVNFAAVCRIGTHLDRFLVRNCFRCLLLLTPNCIGELVFQRWVSQRRHTIWGTSEKDAVQYCDHIEGLKERRWAWRTVYRR